MYQYGKFKAVVREFLRTIPNSGFLVVITQDTPKARHFKVKVLKRILFVSEEKAHEYAKTYIQAIADNADNYEQEKAKRKSERLSVDASAFYKLDDILVCSWGWDQTNVDFYKVIRVLPKSVELQPVHSAVAVKDPAGPMSDYVVPSSEECGDSFLASVRPDGWCPIGKRRAAKKWTGVPQYRSWYA